MGERPAVSWMTHDDEQLLEYLAETETTVSPVSAVGGYPGLDLTGETGAVLLRRLPILFAAGLLEETADGEYAIADAGRAYLTGEADAADLELPDGSV